MKYLYHNRRAISNTLCLCCLQKNVYVIPLIYMLITIYVIYDLFDAADILNIVLCNFTSYLFIIISIGNCKIYL